MSSWPLNGKKGGNRKHSKIDTLPPEMKATVEEMIMDGSATYSDIVTYLEQQGYSLSVSSVCRYAQGYVENLQTLQIAQANFRNMLDELERYPDLDTTEALVRVASQNLMTALTSKKDEDWSAVSVDKLMNQISGLTRAVAYKKRVELQNKSDIEAGTGDLKSAPVERYGEGTARSVQTGVGLSGSQGAGGRHMSMYALQVMTGMEAEITQKLRGKGVDARCPQERRMIRRGGKWQEQLYTLFPSYIFVSTPDVYRVYYAVRHEDGVLHWLGATKGTPEALSAHEEANILWLAGDGPLPPSEAEMQADGTLDFTSGPLAHLKDMLEKVNRHDRRVTVRVPVGGEDKTITLSYRLNGRQETASNAAAGTPRSVNTADIF